MMEFKRVWNIKVIITLLCLAAVSVILFYNEQIQNGTNEIIRYDESYNQNRYSIFDVNHPDAIDIETAKTFLMDNLFPYFSPKTNWNDYEFKFVEVV